MNFKDDRSETMWEEIQRGTQGQKKMKKRLVIFIELTANLAEKLLLDNDNLEQEHRMSLAEIFRVSMAEASLAVKVYNDPIKLHAFEEVAVETLHKVWEHGGDLQEWWLAL